MYLPVTPARISFTPSNLRNNLGDDQDNAGISSLISVCGQFRTDWWCS